MRSKSTESKTRIARIAAGLLAAAWALGEARAGFDATVSPPRFELRANPGEVVRQVLDITNGAATVASYTVKTADWRLNPEGGVVYHEGEPGEDSCRRWVRIERHVVKIAPRQTRNYRFEVHVPPDAPSGECRFALLIASEAARVTPVASGIQIPLVGRIGVIVYVTIGDAKPKLQLVRMRLQDTPDGIMPAFTFRNSGNAHSRVLGAVEGRDAKGRRVDLVAAQDVILPGAERTILLRPVAWSRGQARASGVRLVPPIHVRGRLEYQGGGDLEIDYRLP
ncbi:MAG TPA: hypothetical protein VF203_00865 [Burkholderiales bacterium]